MLGGFPDHPDEQRAQGSVALVLIPVSDRPWRIQLEFGDGPVGTRAGPLVEADDGLAGFLGSGPHLGVGIGVVPGRQRLWWRAAE
jgi:hypothetical protein